MAINGIGSSYNNLYGVYNNYNNSYNNYRLQTALAKHGLSGTNSTSSTTGTSTAANSGTVNFLKQYNTAMTDLLSSANSLMNSNSSGVANDLSATSSDTSIADASIQYKPREAKTFSLDVQQLAQAQQNNSNEVRGGQAATDNMDFKIESAQGRVINVNVNATYDDGTAKTNRQMLKEAASQINSANGNVRAKVIEKDGNVSLQISGKETGLHNAFTVSGDFGAAQGMDQETTSAQNAEYTVTENGRTTYHASDTNSIGLDLGRIGVQLKDTGSVQISTAPDTKKIVSGVEDLVKSYNSAIELLNANSGRGSGVERQLRNLLMGIAPEKSLDLIGISTNKDGTLKVDTETLTKKLNEDPTLTREIISGANGMASRAYNKATGGLEANSVSLVNNDLKSAEIDSVTNEFNFMNMFARSGAYNMNNYYALGLMVNYLA